MWLQVLGRTLKKQRSSLLWPDAPDMGFDPQVLQVLSDVSVHLSVIVTISSPVVSNFQHSLHADKMLYCPGLNFLLVSWACLS